MKNQTSLLRITGILTLALAFTAFAGADARAVATKAAGEKRADVVTIDAMAADKPLELPAVTFLHEQHAKALQAAGKDCASCHTPLKEGGYSFSFLKSEQAQGEKLKAFYHESCIGCHADMAGTAKKTGPQEGECRSCHDKAPAFAAERQDGGLNKLSHYKHIASPAIALKGNEQNCGVCHTQYDPEKKAQVWAKGKEDSWRASYLNSTARAAALKADPDALDPEGRRLADQPSLGAYAHQNCVNCHLKAAAAPNAKSGPADCAGCHTPMASIAVVEDPAKIPFERLMRGQDDSVLMLPPAQKNMDIKGMMAPVSFNHKFHEDISMDCRSCHHKKIDACSSCHSLEGKKEGGFVNFAQAMHSGTAKQSCVGCHNIEKQKPSCAGCHITPSARLSQSSCASCHAAPAGVKAADAESGALLNLDDKARKTLAESGVAERGAKALAALPLDSIPESVSIGLLAKEYEAAKLPHRKIVASLIEQQKNNRMATAFHTDPATLCQGCHHNSPLSKTPPKCASCHGVDMQPSLGSLPSLKAAYHQQCMTCHERMEQKPRATECADCHKPRGN